MNRKIMTHETLVVKANQLQDEIDKVVKRKALWVSTTKPLNDRLMKVMTEVPTTLKWEVESSDFTSGLRLAARRVSVGDRTGILGGGHLLYSQAFNGRIHVIIQFPFSDGIVDQADMIHLGVFEPDEITQDLTISHLEKFLDAMLKWESYNTEQQIGFRIEKEKE